MPAPEGGRGGLFRAEVGRALNAIFDMWVVSSPCSFAVGATGNLKQHSPKKSEKHSKSLEN